MVNTARTAKDFLTDLERRKAKTAKWHPEGEDGESTAVFDPSYEQMIRNAMRYEYIRRQSPAFCWTWAGDYHQKHGMASVEKRDQFIDKMCSDLRNSPNRS